ncbi:apolipoprotein B-100 [Nephila pilipes]|uniref:Apolipoprotein B-100 n=1 Tax=Nephila pilipes TaxID=299642 RepID=A0A8X6NAD2_NEPPI|nr:apolipoprotein B-100 [Nephila pilipes]
MPAQIGWWSKETSEDFKVEDKTLKLVIDVDMPKKMTTEDVIKKYTSIKSKDIEDLSTDVLTASISFYYPVAARKESVIFVGALIASDSKLTNRYHTECEIASSYHNLRFVTQTIYETKRDLTTIHHKSNFSHAPTETNAYNTIEFWKTYSKDKCSEAEFKHNFDSQVFDVSTNVSYKCNSDRKDMHTLMLHCLTNSTYWPMLNLEINRK